MHICIYLYMTCLLASSPITNECGDRQEYGCDARGRDAISNCLVILIRIRRVSHY